MNPGLVSNVFNTALVFEGGGMRASFSSGVLVELLAANIYTNWVGGISAGSSCLANYVSRDPERARIAFVEFAAHPRFGGLGTWVQGKGLFSAEWIYEKTSQPGQALPFDYATFNTNPADIRIGGFRCDTGEIIYWGREDIGTDMDLMKRVRASSTMPGLMPITTIDGVDFCDGALGPTGGLAYDAARADGYDRFLVVLTRPRHYRKPPAKLQAAYKQLFRRYPAIAEGILARPAHYNAALEELKEMERQGKAYLIFPEDMPISNRERNTWKLYEMYRHGRAVSRRQLPAIKDFLGLG